MDSEVEIGGYPSLEWNVEAYVAIKQHSMEISKLQVWLQNNCEGKWHIGMPNPMYFKFENIKDAKRFIAVFGGDIDVVEE